MPKFTYYPSSETPYSDMGWRDMYRMFTRTPNQKPERNHFGVLHVFNAGTIQPHQGYPMHPHDNVEIVTIPLMGTWRHKDTMGNVRIFKEGQVQTMTAGTGLSHSEYNASDTDTLTTMQFWLFTNKYGVEPCYDLYDYASQQNQNELTQIVSPKSDNTGASIQQDAWFTIGRFDKNSIFLYTKHLPENGVFIYNIRGKFDVMGKEIDEKDALGIENTNVINGKALTQNAEILFIEIPMTNEPEPF